MEWKILFVITNIFMDKFVISSNVSLRMSELTSSLLREYMPYVIPEKPTRVNVTFKLSVLKELSERNGQLSIIGLPMLHWNDFRLEWVNSQFDEEGKLSIPSSKIWHPSIQLINSAFDLSYLHEQDRLITVSSNGRCTWSPSNRFDVLCDVDVQKYPFDEHTCKLTFVAWDTPDDHIKFRVWDPKVLSSDHITNNHWEIVGHKLYLIEFQKKSGFEVSLTLRRGSKFVVVNLISPMILLVLSNVMVFVLPGDSGERVGFSITILLAISVFMTMIGDVLPPTSFPDIPSISYMLMVMYMTSLLILVEVIIGLRFYTTSDDEPIPDWLVVVTLLLSCRRLYQKPVVTETPIEVITEKKKRKSIKHSVQAIQICQREETVEAPKRPKINWKHVGKAFDRLCIVFSSSVIAISTWAVLMMIG